jgi:hypothetical protein
MPPETESPASPAPPAAGGETVYAVSYPPAMYARDVLEDRAFAAAMGYEWLHDEDTEFVRAFREQVRHQAEMYQRWLDQE